MIPTQFQQAILKLMQNIKMAKSSGFRKTKLILDVDQYMSSSEDEIMTLVNSKGKPSFSIYMTSNEEYPIEIHAEW